MQIVRTTSITAIKCVVVYRGASSRVVGIDN